MTEKMATPFLLWIKKPSSWISLVTTITSIVAALFSVRTFYLVYADPGKMEVILPDRVGIMYIVPNEKVKMLLPLTFTNTGAPNTRRYITSVTASLYPGELRPKGNSIALMWEYEKVFIGRLAWKNKYPKRECPSEDCVDYATRAFTSPLAGGVSQSKVFEMHQKGEDALSGRKLDHFTLVVAALEQQGRVEVEAQYSCSSPSIKEFVWCPRVNSKQ